jgi:hypothetical protein
MFMRFRGGGIGHRATRDVEHQLVEKDEWENVDAETAAEATVDLTPAEMPGTEGTSEPENPGNNGGDVEEEGEGEEDEGDVDGDGGGEGGDDDDDDGDLGPEDGEAPEGVDDEAAYGYSPL